MELESIVHEVGGAVKAVINSHLQEFGLALKLFNIESIPVIDEDQRVKDVVAQFQKIMAEDVDERLRLKRHADNLETYKVERSFDTTEKAAENIGGGEGGGSRRNPRNNDRVRNGKSYRPANGGDDGQRTPRRLLILPPGLLAGIQLNF